METLKEYNLNFLERRKIKDRNPELNGLICGLCNSYLTDLNNCILSTYPPSTEVKCTKCDFKGYRYV